MCKYIYIYIYTYIYIYGERERETELPFLFFIYMLMKHMFVLPYRTYTYKLAFPNNHQRISMRCLSIVHLQTDDIFISIVHLPGCNETPYPYDACLSLSLYIEQMWRYLLPLPKTSLSVYIQTYIYIYIYIQMYICIERERASVI